MRNGSAPRKPQPPVSKHIKAARRALKRTQVALAKEIGVSGRTLHEWEKGTTRPTKANLLALIERIVAMDPQVGAELRAALTGVAPPAPRPPSIDRVLEVISASADALDVAPRRVVHVVETVLARIAAEGFSVEGARTALQSASAEAADLRVP